MNRPTHSQARLRIAIVAALVAASAIPAPPAIAAASAADEYVLEFGNVGTTDNAPASSDGRDRGQTPAQQGIVGEADPPASPLASGIAMIGSAPASLLIGAMALLALVAAMVTRRRTAVGRRR